MVCLNRNSLSPAVFSHAVVGGIDSAGKTNSALPTFLLIIIIIVIFIIINIIRWPNGVYIVYHTYTIYKLMEMTKIIQMCVFQWMVPTIQNSMKPFQVRKLFHDHV